MITLEYPEFFLVTCYTPNAQNELRRLDYRMTWEDAFRAYLTDLKQQKPVILCGDLNVAHQNIDLKTGKPTKKTPASLLKNGKNFQPYFQQALRILSATFIPMLKGFILGGVTGLMRAK